MRVNSGISTHATRYGATKTDGEIVLMSLNSVRAKDTARDKTEAIIHLVLFL